MRTLACFPHNPSVTVSAARRAWCSAGDGQPAADVHGSCQERDAVEAAARVVAAVQAAAAAVDEAGARAATKGAAPPCIAAALVGSPLWPAGDEGAQGRRMKRRGTLPRARESSCGRSIKPLEALLMISFGSGSSCDSELFYPFFASSSRIEVTSPETSPQELHPWVQLLRTQSLWISPAAYAHHYVLWRTHLSCGFRPWQAGDACNGFLALPARFSTSSIVTCARLCCQRRQVLHGSHVLATPQWLGLLLVRPKSFYARFYARSYEHLAFAFA
eukprot:341139-Pleurochrysis_carterae.AAC.1